MESQPLLSRAGVVLDRAGITQGALFDLDGRRIYRALAYDTTSVDMHGTRILNGAFRVPNLANFPVILFHDGERFPVGRVVEWNVTELGPVAGMVFADTDEAREAELLVSTGFLNGVSIGFIGWDTETIAETLTYTDVEVVELSLTPTPSSRNALVNLQRSIRSLTHEAVGETRAPSLVAPEFMAVSAERGLRLHEEGESGDGLVPETVEDARRMANGEALSEEKWRKISPWIARHIGDLEGVQGDEITPGLVAMLLWGGGSTKESASRAQAYAERIVAQLDVEERADTPDDDLVIESIDENPGETAETDAATVLTEESRQRLNSLLNRLR